MFFHIHPNGTFIPLDPSGLTMALAPAGRLPLYTSLEPETRQLCEDVILNSQKDQTALKRFMAFLNFRC